MWREIAGSAARFIALPFSNDPKRPITNDPLDRLARLPFNPLTLISDDARLYQSYLKVAVRIYHDVKWQHSPMVRSEMTPLILTSILTGC